MRRRAWVRQRVRQRAAPYISGATNSSLSLSLSLSLITHIYATWLWTECHLKRPLSLSLSLSLSLPFPPVSLSPPPLIPISHSPSLSFNGMSRWNSIIRAVSLTEGTQASYFNLGQLPTEKKDLTDL